MNISAFKIKFDEAMLSVTAPVSVEVAWEFFKKQLRVNPDQEYCEEFGFSASVASHYDGNRVIRNENQFQIYMGRLIDAEKSSSRWGTLEINFYFRFELNRDFQLLLAETQDFNVEDTYCMLDDEERIRKKLDAFIDSVDANHNLWTTVRKYSPVQQDIQIWFL